MKITGVIETAISVADMAASVRFYQDLFGFEIMLIDPRICAMNVAPGHVFLIFTRGGSREGVQLPGGFVPGHDDTAHTEHHLAFGISPEDFDGWKAKLEERGIAIESIVKWDRGGRSIYFRDPDHHSIELITPGVWANF